MSVEENSPQCPNTLARCRCNRRGPHEVHSCDCGGAWIGADGTPGFEIVALPTTVVEGPDAGRQITDDEFFLGLLSAVPHIPVIPFGGTTFPYVSDDGQRLPPTDRFDHPDMTT